MVSELLIQQQIVIHEPTLGLYITNIIGYQQSNNYIDPSLP